MLVFDTSLLVSDIEALRARLAALKKTLLGVFVTHPHPDHFNGVPENRVRPITAALILAGTAGGFVPLIGSKPCLICPGPPAR